MTGAQGFVGSWLAERLLADGARVVVPRRDARAGSRFRDEGIEDRCDVVDADVTDYEALVRLLHEYRVRTVFHLAGQSVTEVAARSPLSTWESNVRGTYTLLEACRAAREVGEEIERVVVASSLLAYGGEPPWREDALLEPSGPYGASKAAGDLVARTYARSFDLPVAVARLAHVYGGGDLEFSRLVPGACRALVEGERPVLRSDGTPVCEFVYAEDAVDAYLAIARSLDDPANRGRAWNAGGGEPLPVGEIVARVVRAAGADLEPDVRGSGGPGAAARQELDSSAIRAELGWEPTWDLDRGLAATYDWYRAHLDG